MRSPRSVAAKVVLWVVALGLAVVLGWAAATLPGGRVTSSAGPVASTQNASVADKSVQVAPGERTGAADGAGDAVLGYSGNAPVAESMVVRTAAIELQVRDIDKGVARIRALAAAHGAQIEQLSVSGGIGQPIPLAEGSVSTVPSPASAQIVLRVPAEKLDAAQRAAATVGTVLSQSSSQSDVTQQHIDLSARLDNLKAEEQRLRTFFDRATKVAEMLQIETELSRVRGEIESMQAQVDYLERQAAMSTLTIALTEPAPITSVGASGWGLGAALHTGVLVTAALFRAAITAAVPLLAVGVPLLIVVLIVRAVLRRRSRAHATHPDSGSDD